jgi:hypothetical protein
MSPGAIAKLLAGLLALVAAGVILYSVFLGSPAAPQPAPSPTGGSAAGTPTDGQPAGGDASTEGPTPAADPDDITASITSVDPETGEVAFVLEYIELTPIDDIQSQVIEPDATIYQGDTVIRVSADEATVVAPSRDDPPESGILVGNVVIRVLPRELAGDPNAEPELELRTDRLRFQSVLGQVETDAPVTVVASGVTFEGTGLTARGSEQQGRLQYLKIDRDISVTYDPEAAERARWSRERAQAASGRGAPGPRRVADQAGEQADQDTGRTDVYRFSLAGGIELDQQGRSVRADQIEVWARLRDGTLDPAALRPIGGDAPRTAPRAGPDRSEPTTASPAQAQADSPVPFSGLTTLAAAGPLELFPLNTAPAELESDDLYGRLSSPATGRVVLASPEDGVRVAAGSIGYGFASRTLSVRGVGGELGVDANIALDGGRIARMLVGTIDIDLNTGVAQIPGAGELRLVPSEDAAGGLTDSGRLRWIERADVLFTLDEQGDARFLPTTLSARGEIRGEWGEARVTGQSVRADFRRVEPASQSERPRAELDRVTVEDEALASIAPDAPGARRTEIRADTLEVAFTPGGSAEAGDDAPRVSGAVGRGSVRVRSGGDELTANTARIVLAEGGLPLNAGGPPSAGGDRSASARDRVERFEAEGSVRLVTSEGYEIDADDLRYLDRGERLELTGAPARAAVFVDEAGRAAGRDFDRGVSVTAPAISLNRAEASIRADGAGALSFALRNPTLAGRGQRWRLYDRGVVSFDSFMRIDDGAGTAEFSGIVEGVIDRLSTLERFELDGDELMLTFLPGQTEAGAAIVAASSPDGDQPAPRAQLGADLLQSAVLARSGEAGDGAGAEPAPSLARVRRYAEPPAGTAEPRLESGGTVFLAELSSRVIQSDIAASVVTTPGAGVLRIADLRDKASAIGDEAPQDAGTAPGANISARGATVFRWAGAFTLDAEAGTARMTRSVRLAHLPGEGEELMLIECERLIARASQTAGGAPNGAGGLPSGGSLALERVDAVGAVWATQAPIQLVADEVTYARDGQALTARSRRGNRVTVFDADSGRHFNAEGIELDLIEGNWRATGGEATAVPN